MCLLAGKEKKNSEVTTKTPRRDATRAPLGSVSKPKSIDRFETDDRRGVVSIDRDRFQIQERFRTDPPADPTTPSRFRGTVSGGRSTTFFRLALGGRGRPPLVSFESSPRSPLPAGARGAARLLPRARISPRISRPHAPPLGLGRAPPRRARRSDLLARAHPFPFHITRDARVPDAPRGPADARGRQRAARRRAPARPPLAEQGRPRALLGPTLEPDRARVRRARDGGLRRARDRGLRGQAETFPPHQEPQRRGRVQDRRHRRRDPGAPRRARPARAARRGRRGRPRSGGRGRREEAEVSDRIFGRDDRRRRRSRGSSRRRPEFAPRRRPSPPRRRPARDGVRPRPRAPRLVIGRRRIRSDSKRPPRGGV